MKTKISHSITFTIACMLLFITSCKKEDTVKVESLSGFVQKGPFINGSAVMVSDLNSDLSQSGKTFNVQVTDNKGTFTLKDVILSSDYVSLRADGFYYNEISGKQSNAQITLYALADISDQSTININALTHLEKNRVEYLIKNGKTFSEAKAQAEKEILSIFSIEKEGVQGFEKLDLSKEGDDNAILLALTAILQGYRSESELTELLSSISLDIRDDGVLNDVSLGSALVNHAVFLDTTQIRNDLFSYYKKSGTTVSIPDFGKYIKNFIDNTSFPVTGSLIEYPVTGLNGPNILHPDLIEMKPGIENRYSLAAKVPENMTLKIRISTVGFPTNKNLWYYSLGSGINWSISPFDMNSYTQTFTCIESGTFCDLHIGFEPGLVLIEYFETSSTTPTRSKTITVK